MTKLTWNTATEWDNSQSESGAVHESVTNTDHDDASIVKKGYRISNPYLSNSLVGYYPCHEDSGSTCYDFSGFNNDGSINGATVNVTSILGTTGYSYGGSDSVSFGGVPADWPKGTGNFSYSFWAMMPATDDGVGIIWGNGATNEAVGFEFHDDGSVRFIIWGNDFDTTANNTYEDGTWQHWVGTYDGSTVTLYQNGSSIDSASRSNINIGNNAAAFGRNVITASSGLNGDLGNFEVFDKSLSSSEVQTLYDVVGTKSTLTSSKKTS